MAVVMVAATWEGEMVQAVVAMVVAVVKGAMAREVAFLG